MDEGTILEAPPAGAGESAPATIENAPAAAPNTSTEGQTAAPVDGTQAGVPDYVPNTKFKFLDQEKEFDPWMKPVLNKETEAKVRELYQKAHGLDLIKPKYQKTRESLQDVSSKFENQNKALNKLSGYVQHNDFDSFFEALQIPEERIMKYVLEKLNQRELPPEQQNLYRQNRETRLQAETLQEQNERLRHEADSARTQAREFELNTVMSRPDVRSVIESFDGRLGTGRFRDEVINRALAHYSRTGEDLTAEEAVMQTLGVFGQQATPSPVSTQSIPPAGKQVPNAPVIPNVAGKNTSPTKKVARSLADLRKMASELEASGA